MNMSAVNKRTRKLKWGKYHYSDLMKFDVNLRQDARMGRRRGSSRVTAAAGNGLYPVEVLETSGVKAKVHYIGHSNIYDEWKDRNELEDITPSTTLATAEHPESSDTVLTYRPYSFHDDLKFRVKKSIICSRTSSPKVKNITMPINVLMFNGGLSATLWH